jgi:tetratricopeptide (TPR) repeat protein
MDPAWGAALERARERGGIVLCSGSLPDGDALRALATEHDCELAEADAAAGPIVAGSDRRGRIARLRAEEGPRVVAIRGAARADFGSLAAIIGFVASGEAAGTLFVIDGPLPSFAGRLLPPLRRAAADDRFDGPAFVEASTEPSPPRERPPLPSRGTSVELLAILEAAGASVPASAIGTRSLSEYRGRPPRGGYQDLLGLLDSGHAALVGGSVSLPFGGAATGIVAEADARALRAALREAGTADAQLEARLAMAGRDADAGDAAVSAALAALTAGDPVAADGFVQAAGEAGRRTDGLAMRARAAADLGDLPTARRLAEEAVAADASAGRPRLDVARIALLEGDETGAAKHAGAIDDPELAAEANLLLAEIHDAAGRATEGASAAAEAARAFEGSGERVLAALAFAQRAICIARAGAADRALQELRHAMERVPDPNDPDPRALDVRLAMAIVLREGGQRDKARQALQLVAQRASAQGQREREARARILLGHAMLDALPPRGAERGEAISEARESAERAIRLGRGLLRADLEAEGESVLGELAWRGEDWANARSSLQVEQALWEEAGRSGKAVEAAMKRGQLALRQGDWNAALQDAVHALTQAGKRRQPLRVAQAQLLRGEALEKLDRKDEALNALQEAFRVYRSLGEAHAAQAAAAERRARALIAAGRGTA